MSLKLQMGDESYQIVDTASKAESELVDYGELAELEAAGKRYISLCAKDGNDDVQSVLGEKWVYEALPVEVEVEDVEFEVPDEEEGEEEGEGEEDDDEEGEELKVT